MMIRYIKNKTTGRIDKEYAMFSGSKAGYMFNPLKDEQVLIHKGLPSFNTAVVEDIKSLKAQRLAEAMYYQRNTTRFD